MCEEAEIDRQDQPENRPEGFNPVGHRRVGNQRKHTKGRKFHDDGGDFENRFGGAFEEFPGQLALRTRQQNADAEQKREEDDGQDIGIRHRRRRILDNLEDLVPARRARL